MWFVIAVIAGFIWFANYLYRSAQTSAFDANMKRRRAEQQRFQERMTDSSYEYEMKLKLQADPGSRRLLVRQFMGGGDEWLIYAGHGDTATSAALAVLLCERSLLPRGFTNGFLQLHCSILDKDVPTSPVRPAQCIEMNERFLLKLESKLNQRGCNVKVLYQAKDYSWHSLREDVNRLGHSRTHFYTNFKFVSGSGT